MNDKKQHDFKPLDPAAISLNGSHLIEASAGTGKTYTITSIFLRLILKGLGVDEILVVTFTDAATVELRDRIRDRLKEAINALNSKKTDDDFLHKILFNEAGDIELKKSRIRNAISTFDEACIVTIHSFCRKMLQEHAFESGVIFDTELVTDTIQLYEEIVSDFWALNMYNAPMLLVKHLLLKNISFTDLVNLIKILFLHKDFVIVPNIDKNYILESCFNQFLEIYKKAYSIWQIKKDEIIALIETHKGINKSSYSKRYTKTWFENVDNYLSGENPKAMPGDKDIQKFTASAILEKNLVKKQKNPDFPDPPQHEFFDVCEKLVGLTDSFEIIFKNQLILYAKQELKKRKLKKGIQFFDDLIYNLDNALYGKGGDILSEKIRAQYKAGLIDEFQDTDSVQYRIFEKIFQTEDIPFFLIGDPKQSIYAFRGADIFAYIKASKNADNKYTLDTNWRSDPSLIKAINFLFGNLNNPFLYEQIEFLKVNPKLSAQDNLFIDGQPVTPVCIRFVNQGERNEKTKRIKKEWLLNNLPDIVAQDIVKFLNKSPMIKDKGKISAGDIALLVRTNDQAIAMQEALAKVGVSSVLTTTKTVFESKEAFEVNCFLQAVADPLNQARIKAALTLDFFGFSGDEIYELQYNDIKWEAWVKQFRNWHNIWERESFIQMMYDLFFFKFDSKGKAVIANILGLDNGERRITNLLHLTELLHNAYLENRFGIIGLLRWLEHRRAEQINSESSELRLESDDLAVKLVTIHKSKGLEYPVVYCPFLWDTSFLQRQKDIVFHDIEDNNQIKIDIGSQNKDLYQNMAMFETMAESMRVLYVALTRAKHLCITFAGPLQGIETSSIGYLLFNPKNPEDIAQTAKDIGKLDDNRMLEIVQNIASKSCGAIKVDIIDTKKEKFVDIVKNFSDDTLECRSPVPITRQKWRISSFSSLISYLSLPEELEGQDHDEVAQYFFSEPYKKIKTNNFIPLCDFVKGPNAGNFFHFIFETIDFQSQAYDDLFEKVLSGLKAFGIYVDDIQTKNVTLVFIDILSAQFDQNQPDLALKSISIKKRLNELEFMFPAGLSNKDTYIKTDDLKAIFLKYASDCVPKEYINQISKLAFKPLKGFLKGFIDLVFEHNGKWYIVDYKSNFLGEQFDDYSYSSINQCMAEHHYFLQYHIYVLALHHYLSLRVPDYDYNTHFGKVYYLFLRGISCATAYSTGIFSDKPSLDMIQNLSLLFL